MLTAETTIIAPARRLEAVQEYYFSRKLREIAQMRADGCDVLNLGIGSPDLPPAPEVTAALQQHSASDHNHAYQSYNGIPELRRAFAHWYERWFEVALNADTEVLPLLGSKEGIMHISMAFLDPGDVALIPNPGYPTYRAATLLAGGQTREYALTNLNNWFPDVEALEASDLEGVKLMWINYPHMPTGARATPEQLASLVAFARRKGILLVNDNPYAFILNEEPLSLLSIPGAREVAIELNSLSKAHNMAGWRVGVLAGAAPYIQAVLRFKSNMDSGMFKPIQLAAARALSLDASWYQQLNLVYRRRRVLAEQLLVNLGCLFDPDQTGLFVWARVPDRYTDGYALSDKLLYDHHVFLTPGGIFGSQGDHYVRISLCSTEEVLTEAIRRVQMRG